jgi:hypothetical protein
VLAVCTGITRPLASYDGGGFSVSICSAKSSIAYSYHYMTLSQQHSECVAALFLSLPVAIDDHRIHGTLL